MTSDRLAELHRTAFDKNTFRLDWQRRQRIAFAPAAPMPGAGEPFGEYRLVSVLGHGGFGVVWEAEHQHTRRRVALKIVTELKATRPEALARFAREGQLAAAVNDPHCVFVYSAEQIAGYPVIVMELMPGGTLQDDINARGALPPREAVDKILDVVDGLAAACRAGVLHRDVKPSNCFINGDGRLKIGDFGRQSVWPRGQGDQYGCLRNDAGRILPDAPLGRKEPNRQRQRR